MSELIKTTKHKQHKHTCNCVHSHAHNNVETCDKTAKTADDSVPLGITAESSTTYDHKIVRSERYKIQNTIAELLVNEGKKLSLDYADDYHRTAQCLRKRYEAVGVNKSKTYNRAFYSGLIQCANGWTCPVCSAKIQERRRIEIAQAFDYAYSNNKKVIMITFTFPHYLHDRLKSQLDKLKEAFKYLRAGNVWTLMKQRISYTGLIRALEVLWGKENGWHSHTHEAWIVDKNVDVNELREWLTKRWWDVCVKAGLISEDFAKTDSFNAHAVQITDNCHASDYFAKHDNAVNNKWGVDRELAKANNKGTRHSDKKLLHAFDLIKLYEQNNDQKYAELFIEYADAMRRKPAIFWSHGLKKLVGINEKTDQEIVEEQDDKAILLATLTRENWRLIVCKKSRAHILDLAENENGAELIQNWLINAAQATLELTEVTQEVVIEFVTESDFEFFSNSS